MAMVIDLGVKDCIIDQPKFTPLANLPSEVLRLFTHTDTADIM